MPLKSASWWIENGPKLYPASGEFVTAIRHEALIAAKSIETLAAQLLEEKK